MRREVADPPKILVVDDTPRNIRILDAVLSPRGYSVVSAASGAEALRAVAQERPDLVLLDIVLPDLDGYEVCRRLRADAETCLLPVVMITASGEQQKLRALEAGADDFVLKPFDQAELLARVQSLLRIKAYQDTIQQQAIQLADWSRRLEQRVQAQVAEIERLGSLRRFLSPQLADVISAPGGERQLESHRREITVVFFDLRNFTRFAETAAPEDVMAVLNEYHAAFGPLIFEYEGTLERFTGDGIMVFFNDPVPCPDPTARAVRLGLAARERVRGLRVSWRKRGYELDLGVGIAAGYATLGRIGFEGRFDYAAIGPVTNLAARLCGEASPGQILLSQRAYAAVEDLVDAHLLGDLQLKGFSRPVPTYSVLRLRPAGTRG